MDTTTTSTSTFTSKNLTLRTSKVTVTTVTETTTTIVPTIDLFLSSNERYEIWTIKAAERPELLEKHYDNNNNDDDDYEIINTNNIEQDDEYDKYDDEKKNVDADDDNEEKKIVDADNDNDNDNHYESVNVLPISDGCDIPGWRRFGLVLGNNNKTIQANYDDDNSHRNNVLTTSLLSSVSSSSNLQSIFSIGQGCTLYRKESQLPGMMIMKNYHLQQQQQQQQQRQQQQQQQQHSEWSRLKEQLLSSDSTTSTCNQIQRISYYITDNNDNNEYKNNDISSKNSIKNTTLPLHSWFERDNVPVLIEGCCTTNDGWDVEKFQFHNLVKNYGNHQWRFSDTHGETTTLNTYAKYIKSIDGGITDDAPLAIYDSQFGFPASHNENDDDNDNDENNDSRSELLHSYTIPSCFDTDLYRYITNENERPPYRWILIGPERSGTGLHIDPVGTHAWVTLVQGCKKWILFPPTTNKDSIGMVEPQIQSSIWFTKYYNTIIMTQHPTAIECIQYPGETVFVPAGWPHIVLNLDLSVAVTENYATQYPSMNHLFTSLYNEQEYELANRLRIVLQEQYPDLLLPQV